MLDFACHRWIHWNCNFSSTIELLFILSYLHSHSWQFVQILLCFQADQVNERSSDQCQRQIDRWRKKINFIFICILKNLMWIFNKTQSLSEVYSLHDQQWTSHIDIISTNKISNIRHSFTEICIYDNSRSERKIPTDNDSRLKKEERKKGSKQKSSPRNMLFKCKEKILILPWISRLLHFSPRNQFISGFRQSHLFAF